MGLSFGLKRWRKPIFLTVIGLVVLEFPLTVSTLALFGIADPDTYRTKLWRDGSSNGFNSDPSTPLYAAANYQPVKVPLVWSILYVSLNYHNGIYLKEMLFPNNHLFQPDKIQPRNLRPIDVCSAPKIRARTHARPLPHLQPHLTRR
jgi:hypothetical protein